MTISGLWEHIKAEHHHLLKLICVRYFSGNRIAVDFMGECFRLRMRARRLVSEKWNIHSGPVDERVIDKQMIRLLLEFVLEFIDNNITAVMIGEKSASKSKDKTKDDRESKRMKLLREMEELRQVIREKGIFQAENEIALLRDKECIYPSFPQESKELALLFLKEIGVPCLMCADGIEAEAVASFMCNNGLVVAVYSPDGDCQAHGAYMQIRSPEKVFREGMLVSMYQVVFHEELLESYNLTREQFLDVCITAKCDHNTGIKGVGFKTALKLIKQYGSVQELSNYKDISGLNYEECLTIFNERSPCELLDRKCLEEFEIEEWKDLDAYLVYTFTERTFSILQDYEMEEQYIYFDGKIVTTPSIYQHIITETINGKEYKTYNYPDEVEEMPIKKKIVRGKKKSVETTKTTSFSIRGRK